jgi:hypothetical protein
MGVLELEERMFEIDEQITGCPISALLEAMVSHWKWARYIVIVEHIVMVEHIVSVWGNAAPRESLGSVGPVHGGTQYLGNH